MIRRTIAAVFVCLFCSGCANIVADFVLHEGSNRGTPLTVTHDFPATIPFAQGHTVCVQDPPRVDLKVWVVQPRHFLAELWIGEEKNLAVPEGWVPEDWFIATFPPQPVSFWYPGAPAGSLNLHLQWFTKESTPEVTPRGTVVLLHGQGGCMRVHFSSWSWVTAGYLANAGYRVVMIDLRSQGDSTGAELGFVIKDAQDVSRVLDWLEQYDLLTRPVGIMGHSYGAATGGLAMLKDPRISTAILSGTPMQWRDVLEFQLSQKWIWKWMPTFERERMFEILSRRMGHEAYNLDGREFALQSTKPVMLLHGRKDNNVPIEHALAMYQARPKNSKLVLFETSGHGDYFWSHFDEIRTLCLSWFAEHMKE
ncbi:MAG: alpha/beta fold hydrolase [Phycisphaerae bacterium]|nr:alpha/beta fold hydrolase [Phycisphaerae bacterium]